MDVSSYFRSLSLEMTALKDRIRYLSDEPHWQTDGQWKESVLRSILRRHLPKSASVGTGFVVAPKGATRQIDVLVYDATKPVLFSDGDLVFVASDAVLAIIEVKSRIHDSGQLTKALQILADNTEFIYAQTPGAQFLAQPPFVGLFAYEWYGTEANASAVLDALKAAALPGGDHNPHTRIVNHVALGPSFFIRYWWRIHRAMLSAIDIEIAWQELLTIVKEILTNDAVERQSFFHFLSGLALAHLGDWDASNDVFTRLRQSQLPPNVLWLPRAFLLNPKGGRCTVQGVVREYGGRVYLEVEDLKQNLLVEKRDRWCSPGEIDHANVMFCFGGTRAVHDA